MAYISRRDILASFASSAFLIASPSYAANCDVKRWRSGSTSAKSYDCRLGDRRSLRTTFMRVSDLVADSIGSSELTDEFSEYLRSKFLIQNKTLDTFLDLFEKFSFPFEPRSISVNFDGRTSRALTETVYINQTSLRSRTLGVWDDLEPGPDPFFPLPNELRRIKISQDDYREPSFLRFANRNDFQDIEDKTKEYFKLWNLKLGALSEENYVFEELPSHLQLMNYIDAGSIDGFLPIYYHHHVFPETCTGILNGVHYIPPALYVDLAIFKNTGSESLVIDDLFGAEEKRNDLRKYSSHTPSKSEAFGVHQIELQPNDSAILVQRLLFGAEVEKHHTGKAIRPSRAEYGPTQLPKGVIVDGTPFPFESRSHNALIVASFYEAGSCPYLYSWCKKANEWVLLGKMLTAFCRSELRGKDEKQFVGFRSHFKLSEQEHEQTTIYSITLQIKTNSDAIFYIRAKYLSLHHQNDREVVLDIGESCEFIFEIPAGVKEQEIVSSTLIVDGFYQYYTEDKINNANLLMDDLSQASRHMDNS